MRKKLGREVMPLTVPTGCRQLWKRIGLWDLARFPNAVRSLDCRRWCWTRGVSLSPMTLVGCCSSSLEGTSIPSSMRVETRVCSILVWLKSRHMYLSPNLSTSYLHTPSILSFSSASPQRPDLRPSTITACIFHDAVHDCLYIYQ